LKREEKKGEEKTFKRKGIEGIKVSKGKFEPRRARRGKIETRRKEGRRENI
jgi:hypothetical protein